MTVDAVSLPPRKKEVNAITRDVCLSVCLSVRLSARLLKNVCMDLDEILRVDRCRDMDELIIVRMPEPENLKSKVGQTCTSLRTGYRSRDVL